MAKEREKTFSARDFIPRGHLVSIQCAINSPEVYPIGGNEFNRREFWKVVYISAGSGTLVINHRRYPFVPGFVCLIHPDDLTTWELAEEITLYNILFFRELIAGDLERLNGIRNFFTVFNPEFRPERSLNHHLLHLLDANRNIFALVKKMHHEFRQEEADSDELLRLYIVELLILLARLSSRSYARRRQQETVDFIIRRLREHYSEPQSIREIAAETGLSSGYLFALYKRQTGETIGKTLLDIRLARACELLGGSSLSIETVCYRCGFSDLSNFHRTFKKQFRQTPGEFRKKQTERPSRLG